jgi:GTPase
VLIHVIDVSGGSGRNPADDLDMLRRELALFDEGLARKPQLVAANKIDAVYDDSLEAPLAQKAAALGLPFFRISGVSGTGLPSCSRPRGGTSWRSARAQPAPPPGGAGRL